MSRWVEGQSEFHLPTDLCDLGAPVRAGGPLGPSCPVEEEEEDFCPTLHALQKKKKKEREREREGERVVPASAPELFDPGESQEV